MLKGRVQIARNVEFDGLPHGLWRSTGVSKELADLFVRIPTAVVATFVPLTVQRECPLQLVVSLPDCH